MTCIIPTKELNLVKDEPRIADLALAERLGFSHKPEIRRLIERNREELEMHGQVCVTATQTPKHAAPKGGRPGKTYMLNEGQALVICALSRTPEAARVRKLVIDVFMAWRQGRTVPVKAHHRRPPEKALAIEPVFKVYALPGGMSEIRAIVRSRAVADMVSAWA